MPSKSLVRYHRTAEQRAAIVAAYKSSGLSRNQFADEHGICRTSLLHWIRQDQPTDGAFGVSELIEVNNPLAGSRAQGGGNHRLHFPGGLILEIAKGFDPVELRTLIQLIAGV
jgi:Transposase